MMQFVSFKFGCKTLNVPCPTGAHVGVRKGETLQSSLLVLPHHARVGRARASLWRARPRGPDGRTGHERAEPTRSWSLRRGRTGFGWDFAVMERRLSGKPEPTRCGHTWISWHRLGNITQTNKSPCSQFAWQINYYVRY